MKKVLLFDFDGTLADSFENFLEIIDILAHKYNFPVINKLDLEYLRQQGAKELLKKFQIPLYKIPLIAHDMKKMQQQQIALIKPFDGIYETLHALKKDGYLLTIITSNGKENVEEFLKKNNLEIFDHIHSNSSLFGKDKVIHKFLKQHNLKKDDVLYIGDEIRDIQACKKIGIQIVAVTWGFNTKEGLEQHVPDFLIHSPGELLSLLSH